MQPSIHANAPSFTPGQKLTPGMKERDAWWAFLTGRPESEWDPPKKPKKEKNNREPRYDHHTEGIRSYRSEYEVQYDNATPGLSYATEEGEVEQIVVADPTESLPTPFGSPAPPDKASLLSENGTSNGVSSSPNDTAKIIQREPTPLLLQKLDHVSTVVPCVCYVTNEETRFLAIFTASLDVFCALDQSLPRTGFPASLCDYRDTRAMDVRASVSGGRFPVRRRNEHVAEPCPRVHGADQGYIAKARSEDGAGCRNGRRRPWYRRDVVLVGSCCGSWSLGATGLVAGRRVNVG